MKTQFIFTTQPGKLYVLRFFILKNVLTPTKRRKMFLKIKFTE